LRRLERKLARAKRGSARRGQVRLGIARLKARESDRRKDWAERESTKIARRFDLIKGRRPADQEYDPVCEGDGSGSGPQRPGQVRVEPGDLAVRWGLLVRRLEEKAPGRVEKVNPAFTSQRCSV
jgi:putative transposase